MRINKQSRAGFTLIEIMVAMALTLFVMVILSEAFVIALETFSGMKGIGDMEENLRVTTVILRDDLAADHFTGKRRLSDMDATNFAQIVRQPPESGFFAVRRGSQASPAGPNYVFEGNDGFGVPSYRAVDHMLYMTVKKRGNRPESFYTASLPGNVTPLATTAYNVNPGTNLPVATYLQPGNPSFYASQWTEVLYYLIQTGTTEEPRNPLSVLGTPIYGLYRAQFVMVPDSTNVNTQFANGLQQSTFAGMSCNPGATNLTFYSPIDAARAQRVIPDLAAFNPTDSRVFAGATLVCPNVVSFQIQIMPVQLFSGAGAFVDVVPNGGQVWGVYDTAKFSSAGYQQYGLKAIQATVRVWDPKTRQTRQTTVIQDL